MIDEVLNAIYFMMFYTDQITDVSKPGNPYSFAGKSFYLTVSNRIQSTSTAYFKNVYVVSDDGWIDESVTEYRSL